MVEPEKTISSAWRADYALHDINGRIELLVEAKCLGSNLEKYSVVQQLLSYAFGFGVQKLLITDGAAWHLYSQFKPGSTTADFHFNLLHDKAATCALHLVQWLDAAHAGHGLTQLAPTPAAALPATAEPQPVQKQLVPAAVAPAHSKKTAKKWLPLRVELVTLGSSLGKPAWLQLPDGTEHPVKRWRDILVKSAEFVLRIHPDLQLPLPDKAGKKTKLISWEHPAAGLSSAAAEHQGIPAYIYTNYDATNCIANACYLLQLLPKAKYLTEPAVAFAV